MTNCCVRDCRNHKQPVDPATLLFTVPVNPAQRRKRWLRACKREDLGPRTSAYVCELHFDVISFN